MEPLLLRPPAGFGDHLMLSAVIEGLRREHPSLPIRLAANHPEIFQENPHVERVDYEGRLKKWSPGRLAEYTHVRFRPPAERYLQLSGHLIDDMYDAVGVAVRERPRRPRIYLTGAELEWRSRRLEALPRPRIAIVPFGRPEVRLPNKVYPPEQWVGLAAAMRGVAGTLLQLGLRADGPLLAGAVDLRNIGFRPMAALLRRCDLLVTHVSGVMHLAAAVGTRSLVLYGAAEHPAISGYPWNRNLYTPIVCGPCWMETPCAHLSCMRQLHADRVMEELTAALEEALQPAGSAGVAGFEGEFVGE